jgi:phosphonate transport system permease protein
MRLASDDADAAVTAFERSHAEAQRARRQQTILFGTLFALAFAGSVYVGEVRPDRLVEGIGGLFHYIDRTLPKATGDGLIADVQEWYWGLGRWLVLLFDTVVIAFLATALGAAAGFALCFPASRNLVRGRLACFASRRVLEIARAVPELVYALIFVFAFGIGPLAGVLAIAIHTAGALGKLFSEVNENIDTKPIEGMRAAGGNWFQVMRYGVVPQVLPNFVSYTLLRFEINVRSAAIIGFVGAGGIGQELYFVIRQFIYADISALVILIVLTVSVIDLVCERLRHGLIGREEMR